MSIRDEVIQYLIDSKFVYSYVKKLVYPSDQDDLYEDYLGETWLSILEIPEQKIEQLYKNRINTDDPFYEVRNYISMVIRNTVCSTTSAAYRKLKKQSTISKNLNYEEWKYLENTIPETVSMLQIIKNRQ